MKEICEKMGALIALIPNGVNIYRNYLITIYDKI
jgi:hypothetical protein